MIVQRQYQATVYNERTTSAQTAGLTPAAEIAEDKVQQIISTGSSSGGTSLAPAGSVTVPMPDGAGTSRIMIQVRVEGGVGRLTMTSGDFVGNSITLIKATSTLAGVWSGVVTPLTFVLDNPTAATTIRVRWTCTILPDITTEASFRGMQSTGTESEIV